MSVRDGAGFAEEGVGGVNESARDGRPDCDARIDVGGADRETVWAEAFALALSGVGVRLPVRGVEGRFSGVAALPEKLPTADSPV